MDDFDNDNDTENAGGGFRPELIQSYLAFGRRALRARWRVAGVVFAIGLSLTLAAAKYLPRTYSCTTVMMAQESSVLDGRDGSNSALAGADDIIARHENLEGLIRDTGLIRSAAERRPPLLHLKDRMVAALFGEMNDKIRMASLVGTLEQRITVSTDKGDLSIKVEWSDPRTATELADAARESFLKARHTAEISAFEDKMAILDGHATKLRDDIGVLVQQLKASRDEQLAKDRQARNDARKNAAAAAGDATPAPVAVRQVARTAGAEPDAQLPALKEKLADLKAKLAAFDADRDRRIREEQAKYDELKLRLTSSHPAVVTQRERIAIASQIPSDVMLMQAEEKDIEGEIQQRDAMARQGGDVLGGGGGVMASKRASADPLPPEVTDLLERDNLDPALSAQLSGSVAQYGSLRSEVFSTRVDLDTAQAAFNHRYQVIIPAEMPSKADKPKIGAVIGGGLVFALLLALLLPILLELRTDIIRDRWQVEHIQLPVLAELRLPPHSSD
jgi:uncharacterized protein involved in exopolysaccharide biosynthesis